MVRKLGDSPDGLAALLDDLERARATQAGVCWSEARETVLRSELKADVSEVLSLIKGEYDGIL